MGSAATPPPYISSVEEHSAQFPISFWTILSTFMLYLFNYRLLDDFYTFKRLFIKYQICFKSSQTGTDKLMKYYRYFEFVALCVVMIVRCRVWPWNSQSQISLLLSCGFCCLWYVRNHMLSLHLLYSLVERSVYDQYTKLLISS